MYKQHIGTILEVNKAFRYYKSTESLFEIDQWSALPQGGNAYRQQMSAFIAKQKADLFHSANVRQAAAYFANSNLDAVENPLEKASVQRFLTRYHYATKADTKLVTAYNMLRADAMASWKEARVKEDWNIFVPYLEQVFDLKRSIAQSIAPEVPPLETLVGMTDEGVSCKLIDREFEVLKAALPKLVQKIGKQAASVPPYPLLEQVYDKDALATFSKELCRELGYEEEKGGYNDRVIHAFASFVGPKDARINTYQSGNLGLIFTYIHESGHAMYANGGNEAVNEYALWGGIEGGFHEAIARFYENIVGRSEMFWAYAFPKLQQHIPAMQDISLFKFYKAINQVKPSLRRIGADEVTYSLHGIIRYELERDCLNQTIAVGELKDAWHEKYKKYLGVVPKKDTEGILQDMHWAGDYIGYFQSYVLGNIYDGQILSCLERDHPNWREAIQIGQFGTLKQWMQENIYQYGCSYTSTELIQKLSGEGLDARPFLQYLETKYGQLYGIE